MKKTAATLSLFIIAGLHLILGSEITIKAFTPYAINDTIALIYEDSATTFNCFSNDRQTLNGDGGFQGNPIFTVQPKHGSIVMASQNEVTYTPDSNYFSNKTAAFIDSFKYEVTFYSFSVSDLVTDSAWVYIDSIAGINDAPIAQGDFYETTQGNAPLTIAPLKNDKDPDLAGLKFEIVDPPLHGDATFIHPQLAGDQLFFPNNGIPFNTNLQLDYSLRDTKYLEDSVFIYTPHPKFFGYDSIRYVISEYQPSSLPPIPKMTQNYFNVNNKDADTATIVFFVEAKDYVPVAINDTVIYEEKTKRTKPIQFWRPENNDLDADTLPRRPKMVFNMPFILKDTTELSTATSENDTIIFYHNIPVYDEVSKQMIMKRDSNMATYIAGRLQYEYAPYFCGVDSLFYIVTEKELINNPYPNKFRKDTSNFGIFYFVITPSNQLPFANPDTIVFDWDKVDTLNSGHLAQYHDILANDIDIDTLSKKDIANFERFVDKDLSYMLQFDSTYVVKKDNILRTKISPKHGTALCYGDSVFYQFAPPYDKTYLIDSFEYFVLDASFQAHHTWVYIANKAVKAEDITYTVSEPFIINKTDSTIGSNIALFGENDDHIHALFDGNRLRSPQQSNYAKIIRAEDGNINYMYHKGFTTLDRFQFILSDYLTYDTAWVTINNRACTANTDTFIIPENPFSEYYLHSDWEDIANIKDNDQDPEGIKNILPFITDTIETEGLKAWLDNEEMIITLKKEFFYIDSIQYKLTDIPTFFAAEGLFTRDSAWLYIIDKDGIVDSDGDGIPNLMENGIPGYQVGEETLNTDGASDGPNYLDYDADNDGLKDNGDCDDDGILNFLDPAPGCNEMEVSNAFTPNNDGVNDLFIIPEIQLSTSDVVPAAIHIYDRNGMLVYKNNAYGKNGNWWDGTMGDVNSLHFGDKLATGIYVYYLEYEGIKQQGYVHIQK